MSRKVKLVVCLIIVGLWTNFVSAITLYTVKKGDTLWSISEKFFGSSQYWYFIWEKNKRIIKNPHWIYPGMKIAIPERSVLESVPLVEEVTKEEVTKPLYDFAFMASIPFYVDAPLSRKYYIREIMGGDGEIMVYEGAKVTIGCDCRYDCVCDYADVKEGDLFAVIELVMVGNGFIVVPKGIVQVDNLIKNGWIGRVIKFNREIMVNDSVIALSYPLPIYSLNNGSGNGKVIFIDDGFRMTGGYAGALVVALDTFVKAGDVLDVCDSNGIRKARLVIIQEGKTVGAFVLEGVKEIEIGDSIKGAGECR